ncbi:MAG: TIM-barrel domain-containing protein [Capsulimonas sp.]|uniref:glycoside hydrolase family 31 protein n=1 Tax=Capsulimonas sp. TaxID=2494211 RepID=UPI003267288E
MTTLTSSARALGMAFALSCFGASAHVYALTPNAPAQVTASGLRISVSAVDAGAFHIVASAADAPEPPASPFVVEDQPWPKAAVQRGKLGDVTVRTPEAVLHLDPDGVFTIRDAKNASLIRSGRITATSTGMTLALSHDADQRLYGAGNKDWNFSGDLTHPSGTQITHNGVTRIPFLWSTGGYGALIANNQNGISWADTANTLTWQVPGPSLNSYLIVSGKGGYGLLDAYSRLTGRAPIPPRWTFGFMQSRWGYQDAADIQDKWRQFRDRKIPVDAFVYDYDWFNDDWKINSKNFPDGSLALMKSMHLKFVGIRKPRLTGERLDYALDRGWTLPFIDDVHKPLDKIDQNNIKIDLHFDNPEARSWWWSHQAPLMKAGVDGWWNDEAENTYDEFFQMCRAQWEGQRALNSRRVWTINRAFAPGMQRFGAAVWSGDVNSSWNTLGNQPGTLMNFSMAGMPYTSSDTGGFFGPPSPELYARWMEQAVFTPIMRAHGMLNEPRWPWAFGDEAQAAMVQAIELRYRLIPYIYTCAAENARTAAPLMRPLFLEFPGDANTFNMTDEWMFGRNLLAAPILTEGGSRDVYLPEGKWYDFNTNEAVQGGRKLSIVKASMSTIPVYMRAGGILPLGPVLQYTDEKPIDPLEVRVYPGADGVFSLYEDAGDDYGYLKGQSSEIPMVWNDKSRVLTVGKRLGSFPGMMQKRQLIVKLPDGQSKAALYNGQAISVSF